MRKLLLKIRTSFGSCVCDYADKSSGDTQSASSDIVCDSLKDDKTKPLEG